MVFDIADWCFEIDTEATLRHTSDNAANHCECSYCKNYYDTLPATYPGLCTALTRIGINPMGPSELMPFTSTVFLACYRVNGRILHWGKSSLAVGGIPIIAELGDSGAFFLWVGELELPWVQGEAPEDVISPANFPEFLERMQNTWRLRHGQEYLCS